MATTENQTESIAEQAKAIYEAKIRAQVEAEHFGEFLALDVDSGDWEVDKDLLSASKRLRERRPQARSFIMRVGYRAAVSMGGAMELKTGLVLSRPNCEL